MGISANYQSPLNIAKGLTTMDKKIDKKSIEMENIFCGLIRRQVGVGGKSVGNQVDALPEEMAHSHKYVRYQGSILSLQPLL